MRSNVSIVVNDSVSFNRDGSTIVNNARNKVGSYSKSKIEIFKKKIFIILEKAYDSYIDFDIAIDEFMDNWFDKIMDRYDRLQEKRLEGKELTSISEEVSSFDKLQPMMSEEEFRQLGIDIENTDSIVELQEFKKELMMENFSHTKENNGPVRRLVPRRDINNRGVFNTWMTILISILFLGIFIVIATLNY